MLVRPSLSIPLIWHRRDHQHSSPALLQVVMISPHWTALTWHPPHSLTCGTKESLAITPVAMTPCGVGAHLHFSTIPSATLACGAAPPYHCTPPALVCSLSAPTLEHTSQRWPPDHLTGQDPSDPGRNYHIHHPMWHDPGYHQSHHGPGPQESFRAHSFMLPHS
jgi:hypothetical protein